MSCCFPIEQTEEATARQWQGGQEVQGIQVLGDLYAFTLSLYIICYKIKPSIGAKHVFLSKNPRYAEPASKKRHWKAKVYFCLVGRLGFVADLVQRADTGMLTLHPLID